MLLYLPYTATGVRFCGQRKHGIWATRLPGYAILPSKYYILSASNENCTWCGGFAHVVLRRPTFNDAVSQPSHCHSRLLLMLPTTVSHQSTFRRQSISPAGTVPRRLCNRRLTVGRAQTRSLTIDSIRFCVWMARAGTGQTVPSCSCQSFSDQSVHGITFV